MNWVQRVEQKDETNVETGCADRGTSVDAGAKRSSKIENLER